MSAPPEPVILAEQGGLVVAERGSEILVIDRGDGPSQITAFVLLVITVVCGGFGVVSVVVSAVGATAPGSWVVSTAILAIGVVAGVSMIIIVKGIRARRQRPLAALTPVAVFDRVHRVYRDGEGQIIGPLDHVRFERRMQMTSSSPKLVAVTPTGAYVLKRGNPFGGGIGTLDRVLTHAVHGRR